MSLTWHETNGGPFLVIPQSALPHWRGTWADYDRACAIEGDIGVIELPDGAQGLVLAGQLATAYLPEHRLFARWCYADSEEGAFELITPALLKASWSKGPELRIPGPLVMFDAAYAGHEVGTLTDRPIPELPAGRYSVTTALIEPAPTAQFLLHRFIELV